MVYVESDLPALRALFLQLKRWADGGPGHVSFFSGWRSSWSEWSSNCFNWRPPGIVFGPSTFILAFSGTALLIQRKGLRRTNTELRNRKGKEAEPEPTTRSRRNCRKRDQQHTQSPHNHSHIPLHPVTPALVPTQSSSDAMFLPSQVPTSHLPSTLPVSFVRRLARAQHCCVVHKPWNELLVVRALLADAASQPPAWLARSMPPALALEPTTVSRSTVSCCTNSVSFLMDFSKSYKTRTRAMK